MRIQPSAALLFASFVLSNAPSAWAQPIPKVPAIVLPSSPETRPQRVLLGETVSLSLNGTVADAVGALAKEAGKDWIVSTTGDGLGRTAEFVVQNAPFWRSLDRLRDVYGYDWGVYSGVIVAWPAMQPEGAARVPPAGAPVAAPPGDGVALALDKPTLVADLLPTMSKTVGEGLTLCLHPELQPWRVTGRIGCLDRSRVQAVVSAIGAVLEGSGPALVIKPGSHRQLSEAMAAARRGGAPASLAQAEAALTEAVLPQLTAQQWVYVRNGGEAQLALRELSVAAAALMLNALDAANAAGGKHEVNWTQPQRMYVAVRMTWGTVKQPDGSVVERQHLVVACHFPLASGAELEF